MTNALKKLGFNLSAITLAVTSTHAMAADTIAKAFEEGKATVDFRLRYEGVQQDNPLQDADALTLRTGLKLNTGDVNGFSGFLEFEDVRSVFGMDNYAVPPSGINTGIYSVVADPETTEVNQAYLQYSNGKTTARLGRQMINLDNQRFVGGVAWRQDFQTFDAIGLIHEYNKDFKVQYYHLMDRKRIFAEDADLDSKDHLLNISYNTSIGKLVGYAYLLEVDNGVRNGLDTYGMYLKGTKKMDGFKFLYHLEYATQDSETAAADFDADYWLFEAGLGYTDFTVKLGLENLGSDNGNFGFSTPLATAHKFNGWADLFLATPANGLEDIYVKLLGKALGGKYIFAWHEYSADASAPGLDDYGSEFEAQYTYSFSKNYYMGLKYADYNADDFGIDTRRIWLWFGARF